MSMLRPRTANTKPRSSSMHEASTSTQDRLFDGWIPPTGKKKARAHLRSPFEPYLLVTSPHSYRPSTTSSSDRRRPAPQPSLPAISHRAPRKNPEVQRLLSKPSLLRTTPRPRGSSSDERRRNSDDSGSWVSTSSSTSSAPLSLDPLAAHAAVSLDVELNPPPPYATIPTAGQSIVDPRVMSETKPRPQTGRSGTLPRLSAVGYCSDDSEPSSCKLSIPSFYNNPKATSSEGTLDTLSYALRSLSPVSTPSILNLPPSLSRRSVPNHPAPSAQSLSAPVQREPAQAGYAWAEQPVVSTQTVTTTTAAPHVPARSDKRPSTATVPVAPKFFKEPPLALRPRRASDAPIPVGQGWISGAAPQRAQNSVPQSAPNIAPQTFQDAGVNHARPRTSSGPYCPPVGAKAVQRRRATISSSPVIPHANNRMPAVLEERKRPRSAKRSARTCDEAAKSKSDLSSPTERTSFETAMSNQEDARPPTNGLINDIATPNVAVTKPKPLGEKRGRVPQPLVLADGARPNRGSIKRLRHSQGSVLRTPKSPALSFMSTISTTSTISPIVGPKPPSEKELRRRRFLKLARTLGDDIPPELLVTNCTGQQIRDSIILNGKDREREEKKRNSIASTGLIDPLMEALLLASPGEILNNPELHFQITGKRPNAKAPAPPIPTTRNTLRDPNHNVLRKNNSLRKKKGVSLADSMNSVGSNGKAEHDVGEAANNKPPPPVVSPTTEAVPYFSDHPFRVILEEADGPSPAPSPGPYRGSRYDNGIRITRDEIPWMRASMSLPLGDETPFLEYAIAMRSQTQSPHHISDGTSTNRNSSMYLAVPSDVFDVSGVYRREKRQGWSGEWNQPHIQDVIEKLRSL